jgi:FkbM family methyltransferase
MAGGWKPPRTLEEKIKHTLGPWWLYIRYKAAKELWQGEAEVKLLPFLVDRARNAVDAGANKGTYSYFLARRSQHVYAFEPNPKMFDILRRTASNKITASSLALSNRSGTATLRVPISARGGYSNQGASLSATKVTGKFATVEVTSRRLDECGLKNIGFMKIDVEGFEQEVLEGAFETIERDKPVLLIEMEERHNKIPIEQSLAAVLKLGYCGLFFDRDMRALRSLDSFHPDKHHRKPEGSYIFNFIFIPIGCAKPGFA